MRGIYLLTAEAEWKGADADAAEDIFSLNNNN
jgi:hypothetical protein